MENPVQTTHRIRSFGVLRTSGTMGLVFFVFIIAFFILVGAIALVINLIIHAAIHAHAPAPAAKFVMYGDGWFIAAMPIIEGVFVFVSTAAFCWTYNQVARFTGGIEVKVASLRDRAIETDPTAGVPGAD